MTLPFGRDGKPFQLETQDRSFIGAPPHKGVPIPDQDLGAMQRILGDRLAEFTKRMFTAGWLSKGALTGGTNCVKMAPSQALVDGREVHWESSFTQDGQITLPSAGESDRYDLVFVEFWVETVTYTSTIFRYGNVDYYGENFTNDLVDPDCHHPNGDEVTARLQLRYRTRYLEDASSLSDSDCHVQGKKAVPDSSKHWSFDPVNNIWYCNAGTDFDDLTGYVYALPICIAFRPAGNSSVSTIYDMRDYVHIKPFALNTSFSQSSEEVNDLIIEDRDIIIPSTSLDGFVLQNNEDDPDYAIDIGGGIAMDSTHTYLMVLESKVKKWLNLPWEQGDDKGMLDSGSMAADEWYYIWVIRQDIGGAVDILASTSYSDPDLPSGWSIKRRIGEIYSDSNGHIKQFLSWGNDVYWKTAVLDVNVAGFQGPALFQLTVPIGFRVKAYCSASIVGEHSPWLYVYSPEVSSYGQYVCRAVTDNHEASRTTVLTDATARVTVYTSQSDCEVQVYTLGYESPRGRTMRVASGTELSF